MTTWRPFRIIICICIYLFLSFCLYKCIFISMFSSRFLLCHLVPSLVSGLSGDNENMPVDFFMKHRAQHTPTSTHSSSSIKDEINDEKRGSSISPSISVDGSYACSQCSASFPNRDQLEKHEHETMHSPSSQQLVVSNFLTYILILFFFMNKKTCIVIYNDWRSQCNNIQQFLMIFFSLSSFDFHMKWPCVCFSLLSFGHSSPWNPSSREACKYMCVYLLCSLSPLFMLSDFWYFPGFDFLFALVAVQLFSCSTIVAIASSSSAQFLF